MYQTTYTLVLHFVWYERNCEERVSKERSWREMLYFSCLASIEIGERDPISVGPTTFCNLLSSAKKCDGCLVFGFISLYTLFSLFVNQQLQ